jgi:protein SCO1/2
MPARLRLVLAVIVALTAAALIAVITTAGSSGVGLGGQGFAGAIRPAGIPPYDFALPDQDGHTVSLRSYRGHVVVLTFLYSTCTSTCPITAQQIRGALDDLGHDVPAIAISVDPTQDTPAHIESFLVREHVLGRIQFLRGSAAALAPVWRAYGIQGQIGSAAQSDHSAYVILLDQRGRQRIGFPVDQLTPEGLAHDIRRLQAQRPA